MNLFEKDETNTNTVDIPDFIEDKDESTSVDMSIFKMSDEELYDDVPKKKAEKKQDNDNHEGGKKKSNATIILCLVLIVVLLATSAVAIIYAFKEHSSKAELDTKISQLTAQNTELQNTVSSLNNQIAELNAKIENNNNAGTSTDPNKKYAKGTVLYITEDGNGQGVKEKATMDSDFTTDTLYWGDKVTLKADATVDDDGTYWGKIDKGYIRIEYKGEIWATTDPQ